MNPGHLICLSIDRIITSVRRMQTIFVSFLSKMSEEADPGWLKSVWSEGMVSDQTYLRVYNRLTHPFSWRPLSRANCDKCRLTRRGCFKSRENCAGQRRSSLRWFFGWLNEEKSRVMRRLWINENSACLFYRAMSESSCWRIRVSYGLLERRSKKQWLWLTSACCQWQTIPSVLCLVT